MTDLRLIYYNAYGGGGINRFKELLRVVRVSNDRSEAIRALSAYFERRIPELQAEQAAAAELYYAKRQQASDEKRRLETGKSENGITIPKDELKQLKTKIKGTRSDRRSALSNAKKAKRGKEQIEKLPAVLREE